MVPPTILVVAVTLGRLFGGDAPASKLQLSLAVLAIPLLVGFWAFYLRPLDRNVSDLNQLAANRIAADAAVRTPDVVAEDFWIYWPVAYHLAGKPLTIIDASAEPAKVVGRHPAGSYWLSYRGGALDRQLAARPDLQLRGTLESPDGSKALNIWRNGGPD
jgi:hypothetical protein